MSALHEVHHDCADHGRHTASLLVLRRVKLHCGCVRIECRRCDGTDLHDFEQVCPRSH